MRRAGAATIARRKRRRASQTGTPRKARTASGTARLRWRRGGSSVNPVVKIPRDTSRHAPNVALAVGHRVVMPRQPLPVARMTLEILLLHQESERHLECLVHFAGVERELEAGFHARDQRHDAIA